MADEKRCSTCVACDYLDTERGGRATWEHVCRAYPVTRIGDDEWGWPTIKRPDREWCMSWQPAGGGQDT